MRHFEDDYDYIYGEDGLDEDYVESESEDEDEYIELYQIDTTDAYYNGAFDEDGDEVICGCGGEIRFRDDYWECQDCGATMDRAEYFNYIGAESTYPECVTCGDNYPLCKKWCSYHDEFE